MTLIFHQKDTDIATIFKTSKTGFIQFAYSYLGNMEGSWRCSYGCIHSILGKQRQTRYSNQQYQRIYIYHFKEQMHRLTRIKKISGLQKNEEMYRQMLGEIEINISSLRSCDPSELFSLRNKSNSKWNYRYPARPNSWNIL